MPARRAVRSDFILQHNDTAKEKQQPHGRNNRSDHHLCEVLERSGVFRLFVGV